MTIARADITVQVNTTSCPPPAAKKSWFLVHMVKTDARPVLVLMKPTLQMDGLFDNSNQLRLPLRYRSRWSPHISKIHSLTPLSLVLYHSFASFCPHSGHTSGFQCIMYEATKRWGLNRLISLYLPLLVVSYLIYSSDLCTQTLTRNRDLLRNTNLINGTEMDPLSGPSRFIFHF